MERTERFYKINELLRAKRVVSFSALLSALEVSPATLKRDLKFLCERLHNPIVYSRELGGYQLRAPDAGGPRAHELPGLWFSPREIHALLTMQQLVAGLDAAGGVSPASNGGRGLKQCRASNRNPNPNYQ